jgi:hypothetical protein
LATQAAHALRVADGTLQVLPRTLAKSTVVAGTAYATTMVMAAVFALIFVPALAAVLCMFGDIHGHLSFSTIAAGSMFVALITGLLGVLFRLARQWEDEGERPHV